MKIAFTLCSINYLSQAKVLHDSFIKHNPDYKFIVGLVDRLENRHYIPGDFQAEFLEVEQIGIPAFEEMAIRYNIIELNTSVKPFYIDYFFRYRQADIVVYLDPDICVYNRFTIIEEELSKSDIILTPHILTPITDEYKPAEQHFLNYGLYNLGFIALKRSSIADEFIVWWKERLTYLCVSDICNGLFVDQLWVNLAPVFFEQVNILKHPGLNVAYWNIHERKLTHDEDHYIVNTNFLLLFFHFSAYRPTNPEAISVHTTRTFSEHPDLKRLFDEYGKALLYNNFYSWREEECYYTSVRKRTLERIKQEEEAEKVAIKQQLQKALDANPKVKLQKILIQGCKTFFRIMPKSVKNIIAKSI